jgi:uncharacterized circularly permuted ATP-grasp superfamily protein
MCVSYAVDSRFVTKKDLVSLISFEEVERITSFAKSYHKAIRTIRRYVVADYVVTVTIANDNVITLRF